MCRLYGLHASHPTTPACALTDAQNSLLRQSIEDERGLPNPHGWGIGHVLPDGTLDVERQVDPANGSEAYRREAHEIASISIVAHIRRATVGEPELRNTHPFEEDDALLVHNGHIGAFERIRPRLLEAMGSAWAETIEGETDSEHIFRLLMSRLPERTREPMVDTLAGTAEELIGWCDQEGAELALNVIWAVGEELVGTRLGRSLHAMERTAAYDCPVCGHHHGPQDADDYRVVIVASEPITDEDWRTVDDGVVWWIDEGFHLQTRPL